MLENLTSLGSARSELEANSPKTQWFFGTCLTTEELVFPEGGVHVLVLIVEENCVNLVPSLLDCRGQMYLEMNEDCGLLVLFLETLVI